MGPGENSLTKRMGVLVRNVKKTIEVYIPTSCFVGVA